VDFARQTVFSDPGPHAARVAALPTDPAELAAVVRNAIVHYRESRVDFPPERLSEIDSRWLDRILDHVDGPLDRPRADADKAVGCCRDFTLLTVAALRAHGTPARSRVGFASYLAPDWHYDHVVAEYWTGDRWRLLDAQLDPALDWPADVQDLPRTAFESAAQVWTDHRAGKNVDSYGVLPGHPVRGPWLVRNYVIQELAHRCGDELLLWDVWGAMALDLHGDLTLIDEVAALLLAADAGDAAAEAELSARYRADSRLHPGSTVTCHSPVAAVREARLR
jgi:hypothetical protein